MPNSRPQKSLTKNRLSELWQARRYDLGAFAVLTLFFLIFFQSALFHGKFFVTSDAFIYSYPLRTLAWNELRHGRMPLWTPHIMSGYPLLSMAQIGVAYPLTWGYLFLAGPWAEQIYVLAPYVLFPCFIYAYAREIKRSRTASILAALTFGFGGAMISPLSYNGLHPNSLMWLPLVLIALERSRKGRFISCLLGATAAYAMSVLTGYGQGFVICGFVALFYGAFLVVATRPVAAPDSAAGWRNWRHWQAWQPLIISGGAIAFSAGIAAFQILETLRAQRRSIRSHLTFDLFSFGSYSFAGALRAFYLPLYYHLEVSGYVTPLALALAGIAFLAAIRSAERDWRVFFWAGVAICGFVLTLGENTPVFALLFHLPPFNLFRGAGRHGFELTLAVSLMAAHGWDTVEASILRRKRRDTLVTAVNKKWLRLTIVLAGSALLCFSGLLWIRNSMSIPIGEREVYYYPPTAGLSYYAIWKSVFTILTLTTVWQAGKLWHTKSRVGIQVFVIACACFFEPAIMAARWWWPTIKPATRFSAASPTTRLLMQYSATGNRVYSYVYPFIEEYFSPPRLEPANLTILHGLHNVAGYEPLILQRYSRALGDAYSDAVRPRPGYKGDEQLFDSSSHVLDILNTGFVVSYPYLATEPAPVIEKEGIRFNARDLDRVLKPGAATVLKGVAAPADTFALVSLTGNSADQPDGTPVARIRFFFREGKMIDRWLRIGVDTAEFAHDRPDVLPIVRHKLAKIFNRSPGDAANSYTKYTFITRLALGERLPSDHIEITNVSRTVVIVLNKASLFDSTTNFSMPLPHYDLEKWKPVYDDGNTQVLRNERALPRVWLVAEAEAVDGEEALSRIRGQGAPFDPRRTALLEVQPGNLPALPRGRVSSSAGALITGYENNRIEIETSAETASVLIVGEINYPGWVATVDGAPAPIHSADFLLRGIALPAGLHRVEMRYTAPAARNGAFISGFTILLLVGLALYERRRKNLLRMNVEARG